MNINVWKWSTWWKSDDQKPHDAEGPLKLWSGKVTDLAAVMHARMCTRATCACMCARTHEVQSQQATVSLLWEWETSPSHSLVPGGNGSEHLANQLQLSPPSLKVSPPTGMIYSQVESENRSLCLCFSSSQTGWLAWGSRPRRESETKIMIYKANLDFTFHLCAISKAVEAAARLR